MSRSVPRPWNTITILLNCQPGHCWAWTRIWQRPPAIYVPTCSWRVEGEWGLSFGYYPWSWKITPGTYSVLEDTILVYNFQDRLAFFVSGLSTSKESVIKPWAPIQQKVNPFTLLPSGTSEISGKHHSHCWGKHSPKCHCVTFRSVLISLWVHGTWSVCPLFIQAGFGISRYV